MNAHIALVASTAGFVGLHVLLSHPLRPGLIARLGDRGYQATYTLIATALFVAILLAYRAADPLPLFATPAWAYGVVNVVMLFACILLVGSLTSPNPALPMMGDRAAGTKVGGSIFAITRHPMMWGIALWALAHIFAAGEGRLLIVAAGMAVLALGGTLGQDRRKAREIGAGWQAYAARTSYWPFGLQLSGRAGWSTLWPGFLPVVGGVSLYVVLLLAHGWLFGVSPLPPR